MQVLLQDLRFALRQIVRNPGFSLTSILSLTLGIGATVAVYSILYDAVLHPWPYAGMERICDVWITDTAGSTIGAITTSRTEGGENLVVHTLKDAYTLHYLLRPRRLKLPI